ncbi:hypothetical protein HDU96_010125 [Phlyctochytrium bullatum]|nr:hypothetical protein HDU96_010125 [Phlyctochytrium bullatum]
MPQHSISVSWILSTSASWILPNANIDRRRCGGGGGFYQNRRGDGNAREDDGAGFEGLDMAMGQSAWGVNGLASIPLCLIEVGLGANLYFPNVVLKLVRSDLPPHQAVFRVPPHLNKLDITNLLTSLYGIEVLDVRTMNYMGRPYRDRRGKDTNSGAFKKAVVTMKEDFVFPHPSTALEGSQRMGFVIPNRAPLDKFKHRLPKNPNPPPEQQ